MKKKWQSLFSYLEKTTCETTPDGVFMKESEVDKISTLHVEHQQLTSDLEAANAGNQTAIDTAVTAATTPLTESITKKDEEITTLKASIETLKTEKKTAEDALLVSEKKVSKLEGKSTSAKDKTDPDPSGKKAKLSGNMRAASNNANALFPELMGKDPGDDEEEDETEE